MYEKAHYLIAGDSSIVVEFGNEISEEISAKVRGMYLAIEQKKFPFIKAMNPTYRSLLVQYDPLQCSYEEILETLQGLEDNLKNMDLPSPNILEIPTLYGGELGPDLGSVCEHSGLTEEEVIKIHSGRDYLVYMLGFTPGFSYLGGMDEKIATPRLKTPRTKIPGGSVGIAGSQTGIYSIDSPGGWQLIGKTPILLYDPQRKPPILHHAGDYIRFVPIDQKEYQSIEEAVKNGTYEYHYFPKEGGTVK